MVRKLRDRLKHARVRLWNLIKKRHDARVGGERRKKLAREVRAQRDRKDRLAKKLLHLIEQRDTKPPTSGTTTFDGKEVASWIAYWLRLSREHGWDGYVLSGYRSPAYSTSLCQAMCGAPSCPGRCAGASSNHSGSVYPAGAVDVDPAHAAQFAAIQRQIGSPLRNALPQTDPNHFSVSGS